MTLMVYCEVINKHAIVIVYGFLEPRSLVTTLQSMMNANLIHQMVLALPRKQAHQDDFKSMTTPHNYFMNFMSALGLVN